MNNNQKLTALANEFKATMNHAEKIFNEYMKAAIEQAVMEAFNELSDVDKMKLKDLQNMKKEEPVCAPVTWKLI